MKTVVEKTLSPKQGKTASKNYASVPVKDAAQHSINQSMPIKESETSLAWQDEHALDSFKW